MFILSYRWNSTQTSKTNHNFLMDLKVTAEKLRCLYYKRSLVITGEEDWRLRQSSAC